MTVYYMQDGLYNFQQDSKVTAFPPVSISYHNTLVLKLANNRQQGFRMFIGNVNGRTRKDVERFRQLTYTCLQTIATRDPQILDFPKEPCAMGIMTALRFPTYVTLYPPCQVLHLYMKN